MKIIWLIAFLTNACLSASPEHPCDSLTADSNLCIYTSSTPSNQETCLVWSNFEQTRLAGGRFCLRCMQNLYLTPTSTG